MPRASRYLREGYTFHLTHRCHDRRFLLKFARDRNAYREWLRVGVKRYGVPVYGFCITCSHVHLIVHVTDTEKVGLLMHLVAGAFAQQLNVRKDHEGSVWEHPYQCTIVQDGQHLLNCLRYVDVNMVRAGVVKHPSEWRWCGYDELTGKRSRYRILAVEHLLQSLTIDRLEDFRRIYEDGIARLLQQEELRREPEWTESLAVGDRTFVEQVSRLYDRRSRFAYTEASLTGSNETWAVREERTAYSSFSGAESSAKTC